MSSPDTSTRPNVQQVVPLFNVRDIQQSLRFYVDGLGFRMTNQWAPDGRLRWCWLELGNAALMVQEFWSEGPHRNVPSETLGLGTSLNFICADAIALYHEFRSRGVDAERPFVGNRMWVTGLTDPDGYRLYFESATDAEEETRYEG